MAMDKNFVEIKNRLICADDIIWAETYRGLGDEKLHLYLRGAKDILVFSNASVEDLKSALGLCPSPEAEEVAEKAEHEDENGNLIDIGEHDQRIRRAALIEALEWASAKVMYGGQRAMFVSALERLHKGGDLQ